MKVEAYKFVASAKDEDRIVFDDPKSEITKVYTIAEPNDYLGQLCPDLLRHSQLDNMLFFGIYKSMGWAYDFRPFLKHYVYCRCGEWRSAYAPNRTTLRKVIKKITKILEDNRHEEHKRTAKRTD